MLQIWFSTGYLLLLAIAVFALTLWRAGHVAAGLAALLVGIPLWFGWEYARPAWTTGLISGTEVLRTNPDSRGNTEDIEYIYMRNSADAGLELINEDSWWWLKRNSERIFNDAKTAQIRNVPVTVMWNRWRSTLFSWHPNTITLGSPGSWPFWYWRTLMFYGGSIFVWAAYFYAILRLRTRTHHPAEPAVSSLDAG